MTTEKTNLHPRNAHRDRYDFEKLTTINPELQEFLHTNNFGNESIDFSNPAAVRALNASLLKSFYDINNWSLPDNYLCPPVPGRVDYIHHIADLLAQSNNGEIPEGDSVLGLDVGVGANCIYPLLGTSIYGWSFVGTDILSESLENCSIILEENPQINQKISLQQQVDSRSIFKNIILPEDRFAFTLCNPPFHASAEEATLGSARKVSNLTSKKTTNPTLNFGGQQRELWCDGGEKTFITSMIYESVHYAKQCLWFTTLVSKKTNLPALYKVLDKVKPAVVKTIEMSQGQKNSRILAWTFMTNDQQSNWKF